MPTAQDFITLALSQKGDRYIFGVEVSGDDADPDAFDCSELVEWCGKRLGVSPPMPDGAYWQRRHCNNAGLAIPVPQGIATPGALLFMGDGTGTGRDAITHVAISLGNGYTIEARGAKWGVGVWSAERGFDFAARMPNVSYRSSNPQPPPEAKVRQVLELGDEGPDVRFAQAMFNILLKDPEINGKYTPKGLQLTEDGEWGAKTGAVNERIEDFWNSEGPGQSKPLQQDYTWTHAGTAPAVASLVAVSLAKKPTRKRR